ncbi:MAG: DNA-3-methyladenine glycosylase [Clostridia bacterium]|nr:DNA-3-methyladenine glycosylase [Clostridia bacterium]
MWFEYGKEETEYLSRKDEKLRGVIERAGHVLRETDDDLFSSVVRQIVGQQISMKAQKTIWERLDKALFGVSAENVAVTDMSLLRGVGLSERKAENIKELALSVTDGRFDLEGVRGMSDADAVDALTQIRGVGKWTAEMILLFCLQRKDVFSTDDLGLKRGVKMLYSLDAADKKTMEELKKRYSPFGSVASLYLWEVAARRVPGFGESR